MINTGFSSCPDRLEENLLGTCVAIWRSLESSPAKLLLSAGGLAHKFPGPIGRLHETDNPMGLTLATTTSKVLASAALLAAAAGVAGLGTYGAFTGTTSASAQVTAGDPRLGVEGLTDFVAAGFVPGDSMQRAVTLKNTGNEALSAITLSSTSAFKTALTGTGGLKISVDSCDKAWTVVPSIHIGQADTLTCESRTGSKPLVQGANAVSTKLALSNGDNPLPAHTVKSGDVDGTLTFLRVTVSLPATVVDDSMKGKTDKIVLSFSGVTRDGVFK